MSPLSQVTVSNLFDGIILVGIRSSGVFVFAPFFSSAVIPARIKVVLALAFTTVAGPAIALHPAVKLELNALTILSEVAVSLIFGVMMSLLLELANISGQIVGLQTSFTLVNLIDPSTKVEITLFSQMFQLLVVTLLVTAGWDRLLLMGLLKTFQIAPPGVVVIGPRPTVELLTVAGAMFSAALQLVAPLLAATVVIEVSIALLSKAAPQIPVMAFTVPAKTLVALVVLVCCLSFWSRFINGQFDLLLRSALSTISHRAYMGV